MSDGRELRSPRRKEYKPTPLTRWPSGLAAEEATRQLKEEGFSSAPKLDSTAHETSIVTEARRADAGASAPAPPPPSLVLYGHSSARREWTRQQKRIFQRLTSWCMEATGRGCELLRVDLTTAMDGDASKLRRHQQELRRRAEREFGFKGIEQFVLETTEGNGVLHMVWAWQGAKSFYIPQAWLSKQWERIHGAPVVWVRKMGLARRDIRAVGRYFAVQYLADQRGALVRASWSWRRSRLAIGKAWDDLKHHASVTYQDDTARWGWRREFLFPLQEVLQVWEAILLEGQAMLGETLLEARGRRVMEVF